MRRSLCLVLLITGNKLLRTVVAELAGEAVVAGTGRPGPDFKAGAIGGTEPPGNAVVGSGKTVPAFGREVLMRSHVVSAWAWLVERFFSLAASERTTEVADTAVLVLGLEVLAVLADGEGGGVLSWSWDCNFLMIFKADFGREGVAEVGTDRFHFVVAWTRVLVLDGFDEGTGDHHVLATHSESEAFLLAGDLVRQVVGIGRRRLRKFLGEVVLVAISKGGSSVRECVLEFIEFVAAG